MAAFIVRRTIGAVLVLLAVSFITFAIFIVIPGGDPATRMAGKNATDENIANIRETWGFDQPFYVQYVKMLEQTFSGELISYTTQQNVLDEIKRGAPATVSLAFGAAIIWLFFGILVGVISAVTAGRWSGPSDHDLRADRHLDAGLLARDHRPLLPRPRERRHLPRRPLCPAHGEPRSTGCTT